MTELKPCPFCGGEAKLELTTQYYTGEPEMENAFIRCMKCGVWTNEYEYATEAAAAWNTRHVETCKVVGSYYSELMDVYVFSFSCRDSIWWNDEEPPKFCPECGRKVEG